MFLGVLVVWPFLIRSSILILQKKVLSEQRNLESDKREAKFAPVLTGSQ